MNAVNRGWASHMALAKALLLIATPPAAWAAEQTMRSATLDSLTAWIWFFLWLFSTGGWAIVHLDSMVEWFATDENGGLKLWKSRLHIIQNYIASLTAGVAFFFLARSVPGWVGLSFNLPEMVIFVGVVPAAMGGTATWERIGKKFMPEV